MPSILFLCKANNSYSLSSIKEKEVDREFSSLSNRNREQEILEEGNYID